MPASLSSDKEASGRERYCEMGESARLRDRGFEGFSFMVPCNKSQPLQSAHEKEVSQRAMSVDLRLVSSDGSVVAGLCTTEQRRKLSIFNKPAQQITAGNRGDEDAGDLALKLSPGSAPASDDLADVARHSKRFCPSSTRIQSLVCQVDDCHTDLKHAKDYHRRHKVCEVHSKTPHSIVQKIIQRFCQQCSRFHPLVEFDEGKRSCRRRLAGHNKRRRKTELGAPLSEIAKGTDLLNVVSLLSQIQAANAKDQRDAHSIDNDSVLHSLRKAPTFPSLSTIVREALAGTPKNPQILAGLDSLNEETQTRALNYLAGLSRDALTLVLRNCMEAQLSTAPQRTQATQMPQQISINQQNSHLRSSPVQSSPEDVPRSSSAVRGSLPFLISGKSCYSSGQSDAAELYSRENVARGYLDPESSPDCSNARLIEEQSFFPTESGSGLQTGTPPMEHRAVDHIGQGDVNLSPLESKHTSNSSDNSGFGSDQSPASSSESQDFTGRILFKLCDPELMSNMSEKYQLELQKWLSLSPSCLESCIRPGCVLLTVFVSMPSHSWEELASNLRANLKRLVRLSRGDLWARGRIVVQVGHQRALIINGKVKRIRFSLARRGPLLRSVRPLAVVAGQDVSLVVSGYNIVPQTKIICVYHGRYILHEVPSVVLKDVGAGFPSSYGSVEEVHRLNFPGGPPDVLGRCFIEVEHNFLGNVLPVIVADAAICSELRSLEAEMDSWSSWQAEPPPDGALINKDAEAIYFLHDLGWVFQSTSRVWDPLATKIDSSSDISLTRFEGLLKYAVERDWCAVVRKLLDLLFTTGGKEISEVHSVLSEVNLLHLAVKRKCGPMVKLLLQYVPNRGAMRTTIFSPIMKGPEGLTPLHTAASMLDVEEIIDELTNDPFEVGLDGWKSVQDSAGRTPKWYAQTRGNSLYVCLVERKLLKKLSPSKSNSDLDGVNKSAQDQIEGRREGQDSRFVDLSAFSIRGTSSSTRVCSDCRSSAALCLTKLSGTSITMYRPMMTLMAAVASVCAAVALLFRGDPQLETVMYSLKWYGISYGPV